MNKIKKILQKIIISIINDYYYIDKHSTVGINTFIGKGCAITKSDIGNYCSIAPNVLIGMGEHDIYKFSTSTVFSVNAYEELTKDECEIGHDVWIGANAQVLRGVKISNGAVIGAGAVVTKDVPPYAIVVGVPAKIIKYRFNEDKINKLLCTKYFMYHKKKALLVLRDAGLIDD
jgi:virginiamycin A acetyltransferase